MTISRNFALILIAATALVAGRAQPGGTELTFNPSYSWSSRGDLTRGGKAGEVSVQRFGFHASEGVALNAASTARVGLAFEQTNLDRAAGTALPGTLRSFVLDLGLTYIPAPQWSLLLMVRPGHNADTSVISRSTVNLPVLAIASFAASRDLVWSFGGRYDEFSDHPVIPYAGVHWQFAPAWAFDLAFPRTGFTWRASPEISLGAYASMQGGNYRITHDPRPTVIAGFSGPKAAYLDYREIRAGLGADFAVGPGSSIRLDAGVVTDRKFEYVDRAFRLDGNSAAFASVSIRVRF